MKATKVARRRAQVTNTTPSVRLKGMVHEGLLDQVIALVTLCFDNFWLATMPWSITCDTLLAGWSQVATASKRTTLKRGSSTPFVVSNNPTRHGCLSNSGITEVLSNKSCRTSFDNTLLTSRNYTSIPYKRYNALLLIRHITVPSQNFVLATQSHDPRFSSGSKTLSELARIQSVDQRPIATDAVSQ